MIWARDTGVTGGTSETTFSPAATCTGGQVVTFLWRANGSPEAYSAKAVAWAAEKGLLDNMGRFDPNAVCSEWAQAWMSASAGEYVGVKGAWSGVANDYTRTLNHEDMAAGLVGTLAEIYSNWEVHNTLPIVVSDAPDYGAKIGGAPARLLLWGVVPFSYFDGNLKKPVT